MIRRVNYNFNYPGRAISGVMTLNLKRFKGQYTRAQWELDNMVMTSMVPYMPMQTGTFINVTRAMSQSLAGTGYVIAAAPPMGRFLYEGKVMVGIRSRSPFAQRGEKKVVTNRDLQYSQHANRRVTDHWFEEAKRNHYPAWERKVKKIAGGGMP